MQKRWLAIALSAPPLKRQFHACAEPSTQVMLAVNLRREYAQAMKILFLISSMQGGGAERVAAHLCNAWAERGDEVLLVQTYTDSALQAYALSPEVRMRPLRDEVSGGRSKLKRFFALRGLVRREKPDVIVAFTTRVNILAVLATLGLKTPVVVSERVHPPSLQPPLSTIAQRLRKWCYARATAVVVQTEQTREWCAKTIPTAKPLKIPNPVLVNLERQKPCLNPDDFVDRERKLIIGSGRFVEQKRHDMLVSAFARIAEHHPLWDLAILGKGPLLNALTELASRSGARKRIHFPGFAGNPSDWYQRADIFVMSSAFEGFPNALAEAMANGVPSIAFDVATGPSDLSGHGTRAVLLPDQNHIEALSEALERLIQDQEMRRSLGERAKTVLDEFSLSSVLMQWDQVFSEVVATTDAQ